jgi:hypothetical protein
VTGAALRTAALFKVSFDLFWLRVADRMSYLEFVGFNSTPGEIRPARYG